MYLVKNKPAALYSYGSFPLFLSNEKNFFSNYPLGINNFIGN